MNKNIKLPYLKSGLDSIRAIGLLFCLLFINHSSIIQAQPGRPKILKVEIKGIIDQHSFRHLDEAITQAENKKHDAVLLVMDTPGGVMKSMDNIIKRILNAKLPVITWIGPAGATCGSAGVFILYASHIAAMAPATNLGSATPLIMGSPGEQKNSDDQAIPKKAGTSDSVNLKRKLFHHAVAQIEGLAQYRNRNQEFAKQSITQAKNITSVLAYKKGVVEVIAPSIEKLLLQIHGRRVQMSDHKMQLNTKNAEIINFDSSLTDSFLKTMASPQIAYILFMLGILGIYAEFNNPGSIYPGVIGAICLIFGLYALHGLPLNYTGFALVGLGAVLFLLEMHIVSYGLLSVGGIISITLGSVLLLKDSSPDFYTLLPILITTLVITILMAVLVYKATSIQSKHPVSGNEAMLHKTGISRNEISTSSGSVLIHSEIWQARSDQPIEPGTNVTVTQIEGLVLKVKKA